MPGHNPKAPKFTYTGRVRGTRVKHMPGIAETVPFGTATGSVTATRHLEHLEYIDGSYYVEIDVSGLDDLVRRAAINISRASRVGPVSVRARVEKKDLGPRDGRAAGPLIVTWGDETRGLTAYVGGIRVPLPNR